MPQQYTGTRPQLTSPRLIPAGKQCDIELVLEVQGTHDVCVGAQSWIYDAKLTGSLPHITFVLPSGEICVHILFILSSWRLFYVKLDCLIG